MKCLIDTNVLISASLFPDGLAAKAYYKAVTYPNKSVVCDYSIEELRAVFEKKFPNKVDVMEAFLTMLSIAVEIIRTPDEKEHFLQEKLIRDECDRPILRAALKSKADIILTGDKDFLESGIQKPLIIGCRDFLEIY